MTAFLDAHRRECRSRLDAVRLSGRNSSKIAVRDFTAAERDEYRELRDRGMLRLEARNIVVERRQRGARP